jgi:CRP-like cAMP-binding protein
MAEAENIDLRKLPAFHEYSNAELKLLGSVAPARVYGNGDVLCYEGDPGSSCFVLASGKVEVSKQIDGNDQVLAVLRGGQIVGQMALVDRAPRSATVSAASKTVALELTREVFERILMAHSHLALRFQFQIAVSGIRQLRMATTKLASLINERTAAANQVQESGDEATTPSIEDEFGKLLMVQTALSEWDMSLEELDAVQVSIPRGQIPANADGGLP